MSTQTFSTDGYIIDQRFTTDSPYGRYDSSYNGTTRKMLMEYLTAHSIPFTLVQGRNKILKETRRSRAGILRYIDNERTYALVVGE